MKANWRRSQAAPHLPRVAFEKYKVRASLEEELTRKSQEFDDRRWEELNAYATAVDATIMMALHNRYHFTARVLREIYQDMVRTRVAYRHFFRDEGYELQQTGKNIEDTAILHDLMAIGVDIKAWEDGIEYNVSTGEVSFGE
jgi:hypothetical protein